MEGDWTCSAELTLHLLTYCAELAFSQKLGPATPSPSDNWGSAGMQGDLFSAKFTYT